MKRSAPLKRSGILQRRTRLRPQSPKRTILQREYIAIRASYLFRHPHCEACGKAGYLDLHHKAGRGKNLCDESTFMAVCRRCHDAIHTRPSEARKMGWLA